MDFNKRKVAKKTTNTAAAPQQKPEQKKYYTKEEVDLLINQILETKITHLEKIYEAELKRTKDSFSRQYLTLNNRLNAYDEKYDVMKGRLDDALNAPELAERRERQLAAAERLAARHYEEDEEDA